MDREMLERLLKNIEFSLDIARSIVGRDLSEFISDIRNRYTLRLTIVEIVEASTSLGLYILRELGERNIEGYAQIFRKLVEREVISEEVGLAMIRLARLRNLIVHRYWEVDDVRIYREAKGNGLNVVERFMEEVRGYVFRARN